MVQCGMRFAHAAECLDLRFEERNGAVARRADHAGDERHAREAVQVAHAADEVAADRLRLEAHAAVTGGGERIRVHPPVRADIEQRPRGPLPQVQLVEVTDFPVGGAAPVGGRTPRIVARARTRKARIDRHDERGAVDAASPREGLRRTLGVEEVVGQIAEAEVAAGVQNQLSGPFLDRVQHVREGARTQHQLRGTPGERLHGAGGARYRPPRGDGSSVRHRRAGSRQ